MCLSYLLNLESLLPLVVIVVPVVGVVAVAAEHAGGNVAHLGKGTDLKFGIRSYVTVQRS